LNIKKRKNIEILENATKRYTRKIYKLRGVVLGLVYEVSCRGGEEADLVARGFGPDEPQPRAGGERLKELMSGVSGRGRPRSDPLASGSWRDGRLQPITVSAEPMTRCGLPLTLTLVVAAAYQKVMEELRVDCRDGGVEVHHRCLWQVGLP